MAANGKSVEKAMSLLRGRMLRAANKFNDYNFRTYFVKHVEDDFARLASLPVEEQKKFLVTQGKAKLMEMQRMAIVSRLYADVPVVTDPRPAGAFMKRPEKRGKESGDGKGKKAME